MGILKTITVDPTPEAQEEILGRRQVVDNFPLFSKLDDPEVVAQYVFMMEAEGIDMFGFSYDDLPDAPILVESRKRKKKSAEAEEPKQKKAKKQEKEKVIGLTFYSEPSDKGNSDKPSSGFISSHVDTTPTPPTSHTSTQIPTPIPSEPIEITTPAIISTTSVSTSLIDLKFHSENSQPIPLSHSFPPLNQSDYDVTLTNYSPIKSSDFQFPDPPSPTIQSLSQQTQTPSTTTYISDTIASGHY